MRLPPVLLALATLASAHTEEALRAADAVVAASGERVVELARRDEPDPWLVVDILCRRGRYDRALAFARAAPRVDTRKLPAYVEWARANKPPLANLEPLTEAGRAIQAKSVKRLTAALNKVQTKGDPVALVRVRLLYSRMLFGTGRVKKCLEQLEKALVQTEGLGWTAFTAHLHHRIGARYYAISAFKEAKASWERQLLADEARGNRAGVAEAMVDIAEALRHQARNQEGLELCRGALKIVDDLDDHPIRTKVVMHLANACNTAGKLDDAVHWYEETLRLRRKFGPQWKVAKDLINLGNVYQLRGDHLRALKNYEESLRMTARMAPNETRLVGLLSSGTSNFQIGNYPRAEELYEQALAIARKIKMRYREAGVLAALAQIRSAHGEHRRAIELYGQALTIAREIDAKTRAAQALAGMGGRYDSLGEHARALSLYEEALELQEAAGDPHKLAQTLGSIGSLYGSLGDHDRAHVLQTRRLRIMEDLKSKPGIARALAALASTLVARGKPAEALASLERAVGMSEEGGRKPDTISYLRLLGLHLGRDGRHGEALAPLEKALRLAEEIGNRPKLASVRLTLGRVHRGRKQYARALEHQRAALAFATESGESGLEASCRQAIAATLLQKGDAKEAAAEARRAVFAMRVTVRGLSEELGASARGRRSALFDTGVAAAVATGSVEDACFFLETGRAGSLLESLGGRTALREAAVPEALRRAEEIARGDAALALESYRAAVAGQNRAEIRKARAELETAQGRVSDAVARIQREAKAAAEVAYPNAMKLDRIRKSLRPGEALVLYGLGAEEAVALVATAKEARLVSLGKTQAIEAACEPRRADRLKELVFDPLRLDGVRRLLVCPDGALGYVPFALLAGEREVAYVPSGTTYVHLTAERGRKGEGVLALGDPDYGTAPVDGVLTLMRGGEALVPLPATREEAKRVGDVVLLGKDASEAALAGALEKRARWRAVHFACHGLVDAEHPSHSSLALSPDENNDGFLSCLEVFRMDVPADLVVLSACETARGRFYRAEGIVGLTRAFMQAGAPRVLCSLWKVDDAATSALMVKFYELWRKEGLSAAAALKGAQRHVESQPRWKDPRFWAAWVLWGLAD